MRRKLAAIFVLTLSTIAALGMYTSMAQADPQECLYACWPYDEFGCNLFVQCVCETNHNILTNCQAYCTGTVCPE
jgi:hypothetical protein